MLSVEPLSQTGTHEVTPDLRKLHNIYLESGALRNTFILTLIDHEKYSK